ncbi:RluA family pseudouridine synthase [Nocardia camponoti]|uniref:RluA family pseudouridine synthase n=1 Tax=Nocardia camponoti TaxID=1616106 RepID=UPI00166E14CB|nr:RNA pseudouridine synthase [Nocardia camponoti]
MTITWDTVRANNTVYADDAVLALNKPAGIAVTGERHDTDLVQLAEEAGTKLYPVHRIDKVTSGLFLAATDLAAHGQLTRQFAKQTANKAYLAIVSGADDLPDRGELDLPLSVGRKNRVRIAAPREAIIREGDRWFVNDDDLLATKNYPSLTRFRTVGRRGDLAVVALAPVSGRRHQLRVQLAWTGHQILGDPLFDRSETFPRAHLHSWKLRLDADWLTPPALDLSATPDADFWQPFSTDADEIADLLTRAAQDES